MQVGEILYSSWGYDQTNIDFYEITEIKPSGKMIVIRKLEDIAEYDAKSMTGKKVPKPGAYVGDPMLKKASPDVFSDGIGTLVKIASYASARTWDGKPKSYSTYC